LGGVFKLAAGDVVSDIYSAVGYSTFQPAAGVIVCVTQILCNKADYDCRVSGGGDTAPTVGNTQEVITAGWNDVANGNYYAAAWAGYNHKWFIDNSSYIRFYTTATSSDCGFTGIQTA
tara:strand:+ start:390 stop:743 length:354 start_codon:yes stop_codon:yes gene_type:complete